MIRAGLVQLTVTDDPAANLPETLRLVEQAAGQGASFVLTPECTNALGSNRALLRTRLHREEDDPTLAALRDTLLPKLLSCELRVPDAERAVSAVA